MESLFMKPKINTIKQKIILKALPNEVYDALLDTRKHSKSSGSKATGKAKFDAEFTA
jgi:hypothetical protein